MTYNEHLKNVPQLFDEDINAKKTVIDTQTFIVSNVLMRLVKSSSPLNDARNKLKLSGLCS